MWRVRAYRWLTGYWPSCVGGICCWCWTNCEHVVDACATLARSLLPVAASVHIVATSREPLRTAGEVVYRVPPLPHTADVPGEWPAAVTLFALRAAAAAPGFVVTPDNEEAVRELCRRLDGLPLAIELATVRMRTFWLGHLLERLDDRYRVLGSGDRFEAPRHRTSWVSIDWSYELCSESERRTWARLANFPRCPRSRQPRRWAEAGTAEQVLDDVCGLVDKSVLLRDDAHHQPRYAHCLSGRYVDCVRGDRAADCSGRIEPISVTGLDRVSICWRRVCGELGAHHCAGTTTRVRSFASCCGQSPRRTCPSTGSDRRHGGRVLEMDSVPCGDRGAASAGNPMTGVAVPQLLTSLLSPMPSGGPAPTGALRDVDGALGADSRAMLGEWKPPCRAVRMHTRAISCPDSRAASVLLPARCTFGGRE